ncbi:MAG: MogA/MoaB family molybdenum cofactor biosynthesis protein [Spirochaetales bacterium]|nr:MogA/MoaB family molybdenum cofactor biosynthesis protein [Spirochaetales bacterium]
MMETSLLVITDTRTKDTDESGRALKGLLERHDYVVRDYDIVPDDEKLIVKMLKSYCHSRNLRLILTCGGTGCGPRDVTPEATLKVLEKIVPGIAEHIRSSGMEKTRNAALSRGVAGITGNCLIINLPGSVKGAVESLEAVLDIIGHCFKMMAGEGH